MGTWRVSVLFVLMWLPDERSKEGRSEKDLLPERPVAGTAASLLVGDALCEGEEPEPPELGLGGETDREALPEDVGIGFDAEAGGATAGVTVVDGWVGFFLSSHSLMRSRMRLGVPGDPALPGDVILQSRRPGRRLAKRSCFGQSAPINEKSSSCMFVIFSRAGLAVLEKRWSGVS